MKREAIHDDMVRRHGSLLLLDLQLSLLFRFLFYVFFPFLSLAVVTILWFTVSVCAHFGAHIN